MQFYPQEPISHRHFPSTSSGASANSNESRNVTAREKQRRSTRPESRRKTESNVRYHAVSHGLGMLQSSWEGRVLEHCVKYVNR